MNPATTRHTLNERFPINGIDATTGGYYLPSVSISEIAALARSEEADFVHLQEASRYSSRLRAGTRLVDDRSTVRLEEAGWGVIFAEDADPAIREALSDLLDLRREQANRIENLYRVFDGELAYRRGETKAQFLTSRGSGPGEVDPRIVPYYLLLVGSPEEVPFHFQYQLDMRYAVGRICFGSPDEYYRYAQTVVAAELGRVRQRQSEISLFGPAHAGDWCTEQSSRYLIGSLAERLEALQEPGWRVRSLRGPEATKQQLQALLGGPEKPDILVTATHGLWFPKGNSQQRQRQGALMCQDWPGPRWNGPVPPEWYFSAEDVADDAILEGLITFHFACYSGGTPRLDDFDWRPAKQRVVLASEPFVAALPQRLLSHPRGGALAVVAHVDQAWGHSFLWNGRQWTGTFDLAFRRLLQGHPIGWAMEPFNLRYAELVSDLRNYLDQEMEPAVRHDDLTIADLWTATNDTRGFVVLGDPAVCLPRATQEVTA